MSTRCLIGRVIEGRKIMSIYCHHDGYRSGVGNLLLEHYNTPELIDGILGLGDISSLDYPLLESDAYKYRGDKWEDVRPYIVKSQKDYLKLGSERWAEYIYLYDEAHGWRYSTGGNFYKLKYKERG